MYPGNPLPSSSARKRRATILDVADAVELLTEQQVAADYNIARKTLQNWRYAQPPRGPAYQRAGRKILYSRIDVDSWLQSHRVEPKGCGA